MRIARLAFAIAGPLLTTLEVAFAQQSLALKVGTILDGNGHVLHNVSIVVEGSKIARIDPEATGTVYDLRGLTVLPGWIDAHVHITWHFGPNGRAYDKDETPAQAALGAAANAWATLMGGFTTVQSVGAPEDKDLDDAIARSGNPGPRILTALSPLVGGPNAGTPDQIRESIRKLKSRGADLVKIFASKSIREGGGETLTQAQLEAACGEAKALGLRTLVHAYGPAVRTATLASCTQIEHGTYATDDDLKLMAEHGTYLDPQAGLVIYNYLDNESKFLGIGNYNAEGFALMRKVIPLDTDLFKRALATPNLKIVFGTDAVAGAHGRNAEEFIYRVRDCGQDPMAAMVSANWLGAAAMGLGNKIGVIAPGFQADIIALDGDPLRDITAVRRVVFVMKGGVVYKNQVPAPAATK